MSFSENIQSVIQSLVENLQKETLERNQQSIQNLQRIHDENPDKFLNVIQYAVYDLYELAENILPTQDVRKSGIIKHIMTGLYAHYLTKRITVREGSACSVDKASFITNMTLRAIHENKNLSLFSDYSKHPSVDGDRTRQAYWSPTSITDTDHAMQLFWDWYHVTEDAAD